MGYMSDMDIIARDSRAVIGPGFWFEDYRIGVVNPGSRIQADEQLGAAATRLDRAGYTVTERRVAGIIVSLYIWGRKRST